MLTSFSSYYQKLPSEFLATRLDDLTDGIFRWRTIKNFRSKGKIPENCFIKASPRKILIRRDAFFEWAEMYAKSAR